MIYAPWDKWTKGRIINKAITEGANSDAVDILKGLSEDAVKNVSLTPAPLWVQERAEQKLYGVDVDFIKSLGGYDDGAVY